MATAIYEDKTIDYVTLGNAAQGAIQAGENQQNRLEEFTSRVGSGEFHRPTEGTIPTTCIDGRCGGDAELMPNAAGGSETLMVATDLTINGTADRDTTCNTYTKVITTLKSAAYPIGGHTAVDRHGAPSGCGANDKLPAIYAYISQHGETLRSLTTGVLGYEISDEDHDRVVGNAASRAEFSGGDELLAVLQENGGRVDLLRGEHTEVLAVINRRPQTTLDRDAVEAEFGDAYEAFNVDEWAFDGGASALDSNADENTQRLLKTAMAYYNFATAGVLCGPGMRVTVLA